VDLDAFAWLLTPEGQAVLTTAERLRSEGTDPLKAGAELRRATTPERAALASAQADLRAAAVVKLGPDARRMYFTPDGLEQ
jgi:hypothetical protein